MNSNKVITAYFGISPAVDMSMLNGDTTVRLIDVRPKANYEKEHIPGAISIPFEEIFTRYAEIPIGSRVIVYSDCL
ncbi:MAG TPA: rhodanese-like domain-containing protein [Dehalococcoidales bacterium]|nr:rhodanese-like domain-containing protein [Dehalococcoidales bacterium]